MLVLGIETSCDDTGVALVRDGHAVIANLVSSQPEHARYGGVVPEIAARRHLETLPTLLESALAAAGATLDDVEGIAVTRGPGLIGALLAGWCFGRGLAAARRLPYVGVHHLAAHVHGALMPTLERGAEVDYPLLALVVSGGHTALYRVAGPARFELVGQTRDDAAGEAFDKVAKLLELGYPGGPLIDELAEGADAHAWPLPRSDLGLDFTFSGLKTAVRRAAIQAAIEPGQPHDSRTRDLVASFQAAAIDMLVETSARALRQIPARGLVLCGGVAANRLLGRRFRELAEGAGLPLYVSPRALATDNAAMIAGAGAARLARGDSDVFDLAARAQWALGAAND